jgi:hypothetical protein
MKVLLLLVFLNGYGGTSAAPTYTISEDMPSMGVCKEMENQIKDDAAKANQRFVFGGCYLK